MRCYNFSESHSHNLDKHGQRKQKQTNTTLAMKVCGTRFAAGNPPQQSQLSHTWSNRTASQSYLKTWTLNQPQAVSHSSSRKIILSSCWVCKHTCLWLSEGTVGVSLIYTPTTSTMWPGTFPSPQLWLALCCWWDGLKWKWSMLNKDPAAFSVMLCWVNSEIFKQWHKPECSFAGFNFSAASVLETTINKGI